MTKIISLRNVNQEPLELRGIRLASLSDLELLSLIMGTSNTRLSQELFKSFGSLSAIASASLLDLMKVRGIGKRKAWSILAAFEIYRRKCKEELSRTKINSAEAVAKFLRCV